MNRSLKVLVASVLVLAPTLLGQAPRRPRGAYAVVDTEKLIGEQSPSSTSAQLDSYFNGLYAGLLANPAISGLALQVHWDRLNPNPPGANNSYTWNIVDDAFAEASAWNSQNPTQAPKNIQLIVTPGFQSPQWILNQIPSCDGLFQTPAVTPPSTCGKATFTGFSEAGDGDVLPLPWNPVYKNAWQTFVTALAARYGSNPLFASIAITGPTAASAEMNLPNDGNSNNPQTQFGTAITPGNMWIQLQTFHYGSQAAYVKTNQAFIDEWENAINLFGQILSGVTLVATTGNGFPNFAGAAVNIPPAFAADCANNPNPACAAATTILAYFMQPSVGGANAKATQDSGMAAARAANNLGVAGVRQLSQMTAQLTGASAQILGGSQFTTSFSTATLQEGCTSTFPPDATDTPAGCAVPASCTTNNCLPVACIPQACLAPGVTAASLATYQTLNKVPAADLISPEQAEYNVMNVYFDGTPAAAAFGGTPGTAPLNYLQIYHTDIQYASTNANAQAPVVEGGGAVVSASAQDLLNLASQKLFGMAEPPLLPAIAPGGIVPATIEAGQWASIFGTNLAAATATWTANFPTALGNTSVTIGGKSAYLSYVSYGQINLQVPNLTTGGSVPVVVTTAAGSVTSMATVAQVSPTFFLLDATHVAGIILRSGGKGAYGGGSYDIIGPTGGSLGYPTVAAKAGDVIELFGTGFGPTNPAVLPGQLYSGAAPTANPVSLRINNVTVTPSFAGLSGAGLYQINLTVPSGLGTGDLTLQALTAGAQSPPGVVLSVQ